MSAWHLSSPCLIRPLQAQRAASPSQPVCGPLTTRRASCGWVLQSSRPRASMQYASGCGHAGPLVARGRLCAWDSRALKLPRPGARLARGAPHSPPVRPYGAGPSSGLAAHAQRHARSRPWGGQSSSGDVNKEGGATKKASDVSQERRHPGIGSLVCPLPAAGPRAQIEARRGGSMSARSE
jgi:hypothetical protein